MDSDRDPLDVIFNGLESHHEEEEDNHETEDWIDHDNWDEEETVQDGSEILEENTEVNEDEDVSQDEDLEDDSEDEVSEVPSFLGDSFVTSTGIKKNQGVKTYSSGLSPITEASTLFFSPISRDLRSQDSHSQVLHCKMKLL